MFRSGTIICIFKDFKNQKNDQMMQNHLENSYMLFDAKRFIGDALAYFSETVLFWTPY